MFNRTFGVEIETLAPFTHTYQTVAAAITAAGVPCHFAGYTHATGRTWKIVSDVSVQGGNGMEIVSPPLSGEDGFEQVRRVCGVLTSIGCRINSTCGLHVHVDARRPALDLPAFKRLALLYAESEAIIDMVLPPSRRGNTNNYCKSIAHATAKIAAAHDINGIIEAIEPRDHLARYVKLNFKAFWRHGTVEFRHHSGTVDADKVINWTKACLRMVERAVIDQTITAESVNRAVKRMKAAREGSKNSKVRDLLLRPEGCTTREVCQAMGWKQASVAGIGHSYGLTLRKQKEWEHGKKVTRYFGYYSESGPAIKARGPRSKPTVTVSGLKAPKTLEDFTSLLNMSDEEKAFWKQRAELFANATTSIGA